MGSLFEEVIHGMSLCLLYSVLTPNLVDTSNAHCGLITHMTSYAGFSLVRSAQSRALIGPWPPSTNPHPTIPLNTQA